MTSPVVHAPSRSMVCAGCDGTMLLRKNAVGMESLRCPKCSPFARDPYRHPDDAMLPQGLVKTNGAPPRVIREIVRVLVPAPAPPPEIRIELPPIAEGQLRCQLCSRGVSPHHRFCGRCAEAGQLLLADLRAEEREAHGEPPRERRYAPKPCAFPVDEEGTLCGELFTPTSPRSDLCDRHRVEVMRAKWRAERKAHRGKRVSNGRTEAQDAALRRRWEDRR